MFRPDKKLKRKHQHKDWRKKRNILTAWKRTHENDEKAKPPVTYPKSRKVTLKKDEQTKSKNKKGSVRGPVGPNNN